MDQAVVGSNPIIHPSFASVVQLDRATDFGSVGWGFESLRTRFLVRVNPTAQNFGRMSELVDEIDLGSIGVSLLLAIGLIILVYLDRIPKHYLQWKILRGLSYLGNDTRKLFLNLNNIFSAIGWGITTHINLSLAIFCLALGLGIEIQFLDCLI